MSVNRLRIWSEFLAPEELGSSAVLSLLQRFELEPLVALPPQAETPAMAAALARLSAAGLRLGLWPLLSDEEGYWPSEKNAAAARARVGDALRFAESAGATVQVIAIDLEPPLGMTQTLLHGTSAQRARLLSQAFVDRHAPGRAETRAVAAGELMAIARELAAREIETIAAVIPPVMLDLAAGTDFWQALFQTPAAGAGWSVVSPMMYTSMIGSVVGRPMAVQFVGEAARLGVRALGPKRASVSIGLVSSGKMEDERAYCCPDELAEDAAIARAAGVRDLALFCLEGVLHRGDPESWLRAFASYAGRRRRKWSTALASRVVTRAMLTATRRLYPIR